MSEHQFMIVMLIVAVLSLLVLGVFLGTLVYRTFRKSERIDGITAAIYLEARKLLEQRR